MQFKRIAVDTSKATFTVHGVDAEDRPILRQNLSRAQFEAFCRKLAPTELVLEACGGSHHWGRLLQSCGHTVRLIPPQYVKPFVKRGKNDRNDAAAISEAASRPDMRSVPVKPLASQAEAVDLSVRDLLIRQRTQLVNAMRGHAAEFGIIAARGIAQVGPLLDKIAGSEIPQAAKDALAQLGQCIEDLDDHRAAVDQRLTSRHKANSVSQRLAAV
ncbi:MAG: IS110 family transposase, partial [Janthinobacterium lividum]